MTCLRGGVFSFFNPCLTSKPNNLTHKSKFSILCCAILLNTGYLKADWISSPQGILSCSGGVCELNGSHNGFIEAGQGTSDDLRINGNLISNNFSAIIVNTNINDITNNANIRGEDYGIYNSAIISQIINNGSIQGNKAGIYNQGEITKIENHSTLSIINENTIGGINNFSNLNITNVNNASFGSIKNEDSNTINIIDIKNTDSNTRFNSEIENLGRGNINITNVNSKVSFENYIDNNNIYTGNINITNTSSDVSFNDEISNNNKGNINIQNANSNVNFSDISNINTGNIILTSTNSKIEIHNLGNYNSGSIILTGGSYYFNGVITNENQNGKIQISDINFDLKDFSTTGQISRLSLSGGTNNTIGGINQIQIDKITFNNALETSTLEFIKDSKNISQFVSGALINNNSVDTNTYDYELDNTYNGTLIDTFKAHIQDKDFFDIYGITSFNLSIKDERGNLQVLSTPENSASAELNKILLSSMQRRANFIDNAISSSINDLAHKFSYDKFSKNDINNNLYASALSDLGVSLGSQNLEAREDSLFVLPYFSSLNIDLDNGDKAKGHNQGLIAGLTGLKGEDMFYSLYLGYEDMNVKSQNYKVDLRGLYGGFKILDFINNLNENTEFFVQYNGNLALMNNDINNRESAEKADPNSYFWTLGADLGVNYLQEKNTFTPKWGLAYEGGNIDSYTLDQGLTHFDKTNFNLFHTKASLAWARSWTSYFITNLQGGVKYYFNPNVDYSYFNPIINSVSGKTRLDHWNEFIGVDFIIPLNYAFYFKISYNGNFSKDGDTHTAFARFNYLF